MKLDDAQLMQLDQLLCFPIYAATNLFGRLYRPLLDRIGLTYPQYLTMLVLWEFGTQSVGELGARLYLDSGTLTPLLKRLEQAGWVVRERSTKDERRVEVSLTAAGRALKKKALEVPRALVCMTELDMAKGVRLRDDMKKLISVLEGALDKGDTP
jgi:DNA-binding MarR family transcriptional regulator